MDRKLSRNVWKTRSSNRQNAPSEDGSVGSALRGIEGRRHAWPSRRLLEAEGAPPFWRPGNVVGPQRPPGTCSPAPRPTPHTSHLTPLAAGRELGLFSCSIPPWFVLSNALSTTNTRAIWLCFGAFLSPPASSLQFHWLQFSLHSPLATTSYDPSPLATTDSRIGRDRTGPNRDEHSPSLQYGTKPGDPYGKIHPFVLARRRWTVDHSLAAGGAQRQWLPGTLKRRSVDPPTSVERGPERCVALSWLQNRLGLAAVQDAYLI